MGYVVIHLDKSPGNESAMTDHIERKVIHPNVDKARTHLNKELINSPEGVNNRTEAIQHRLKNAGLGRQIGKNQVQVIRIMLSGTSEDMMRIQDEGKLDEWCQDSINYLKKTFGEENLVAATLHLDETTPHIHASVVPIVRGERRKKKPKEQQTIKKQYRKKDPNRPRLCADDVMARNKLIEYQDTYAEAMKGYGLERGEKGSEARHITLTEFYRNQVVESKSLQTNIELLLAVEDAKRQSIEELKAKEQEAKQRFSQAEKLKQLKESELKETDDALKQAKGQLKTEKLKNTAADVGSTIIEGLSSVIGTSKVKRQQQEIETLKAEKDVLIQEVKTLKQNTQIMQKEHETALDKLKHELKRINDLFPQLKELLWVEKLLKVMRFSEGLIKEILKMKPVGFKGSIYSPEFQRSFDTKHSIAEVKPHPTEKDKLQLTVDGISETSWFRQKYREFQKSIGMKLVKNETEIGKRKGFKV